MQHHYRGQLALAGMIGACLQVSKSLVIQNAVGSPLEVFRNEANHASHVALKDTSGADLRCDDLSNDGVERSRSAACKMNLLDEFEGITRGLTSDCNGSSRSLNFVRKYSI